MRLTWLVLLAACGGDSKSPVDAAPAADATSTATLAISPMQLDFGSVGVGTSSQVSTVTISSTGATALGLVVANDDARFVRHGTTCGATLAAGASCTFDIAFAPVAMGVAGGHFTAMAMNATTAMIPLAGIATSNDDILTVSPFNHAFGSVAISQTASQTFTFSNLGPSPKGPLVVGLAGTDPAQFAIANDTCSNQTLPASGSCTLDAVFAPNALGTQTAVVTVTAMSTVSAALSGDGVAPPP